MQNRTNSTPYKGSFALFSSHQKSLAVSEQKENVSSNVSPKPVDKSKNVIEGDIFATLSYGASR